MDIEEAPETIISLDLNTEECQHLYHNSLEIMGVIPLGTREACPPKLSDISNFVVSKSLMMICSFFSAYFSGRVLLPQEL